MPALRGIPFVIVSPQRGRMVVKAASREAEAIGIVAGMVVADAKAVFPTLQVLEDRPDLANKLLTALAHWCIRFTPAVAVDHPAGLVLDASGCSHLWGGEAAYLQDITTRLQKMGYDTRAAIASTIGAAWAAARYSQSLPVVAPGTETETLLSLPPSALRLEAGIIDRMNKLGLRRIDSFIRMQRSALRRRFGASLLLRLDQALGREPEFIIPIVPLQPWQERLPCPEPIQTATGIEIALSRLLDMLCARLEKEGKGLRQAIFKGLRLDGKLQQVEIGTTRASRNKAHLFKLFEIKIPTIEPDLGIELFLLEAPVVEELCAAQDKLWSITGTCDNVLIAELLDRLTIKTGTEAIRRYLPAAHYWPERSVKIAASLQEKATTTWRTDLPRPLHLLKKPEPVEVMVRVPDYPPVHFRYEGKLHVIKKADGPERIEQEWWIEKGLHRDYYCVEDEKGCRYWLFRAGGYDSAQPKWFIHGFFA